jgi:hypothetical protein
VASLAGAAVWYAEQGHLVFPLSPGTKVPLKGSRGLKDAVMNPDTVRKMWAYGDYNIGLRTGHLFDVIDFDGPEGMDSYAHLSAAGKLPPMLGLVETPHGAHYLIAPTGDGNAARVLPGVDYRGNGGYVVAPPSIVNGVQYKWAIPPVIGPTS